MYRTTITLACAVLGIGLALNVSERLGRDRVADTIEYFEPDADALVAFEAESATGTDVLAGDEDPPLRRFRIPAYLAARIFPTDGGNRYDPATYYAYRPNMNHRIRFQEHPKKRWFLRTNGLGMRRDEEVAEEPPALRVLVAGDSHADGVCNNEEGFPALVEAELERRHPGRAIEVLNASHGGYEPYNYLGVLEKYLYLKPDAFVVMITGGNDFTGVLQLAHMFEGTAMVGLPVEELEHKQTAMDTSRPALASGCHALHYFKHVPGELDFALDATSDVLREIVRVCRHEGIRPLLIYLPAQAALDWEDPPSHLVAVKEVLGLTPGDLELADTLRDRLLDACEELGLPAVDLGDVLRPDAHFYRSDLHLNTHGQAAVAELLVERFDRAPELQP